MRRYDESLQAILGNTVEAHVDMMKILKDIEEWYEYWLYYRYNGKLYIKTISWIPDEFEEGTDIEFAIDINKGAIDIACYDYDVDTEYENFSTFNTTDEVKAILQKMWDEADEVPTIEW